ncbi:hypothetical protein [[Mycoplasma] imitans]|uniref:hypothetical protein n=1 Tax=[Mycoplasma] imitans TaxID=29560 RepID=UPI0004809343|nr:hypothetical protein [[Mycoplasma] imitans]
MGLMQIKNQTKFKKAVRFGQYHSRKILSIMAIILIVICAGLFIYYINIFPGFVNKDQQFVLEHLSVNKDSSIGMLNDGRFAYQGTRLFVDKATYDAIVQKLLAKSEHQNTINFGLILNFSGNEKFYLINLRTIAEGFVNNDQATINTYLANPGDYSVADIRNIGILLQGYNNAILQTVPTSAPLRKIFDGLSVFILVLYLLATVLQILVLRWLFKGTRNGDRIYKYIITLSVVALIATFFLISLKPIETQVVDGNTVQKVVTVISGVEVVNEVTIPNVVKNPDVMNYWGMWLTLALALIITILSAQAKKRYGYLTHSVVLEKKMVNTKEISDKIDAIMESSIEHNNSNLPIKNN